jgi:hypothetical protein
LKPQRYPAGQLVIHQGERADRFYIVVSGRAEVFRERPGEVPVMLTTLQPGEYFGEIGVLRGGKRTASVRASLDDGLDVLSLGRDALLRVDLALSALAVALGSLAMQVSRPPRAPVLVGVLPPAVLLLAQGGARMGRERARERTTWPALGADSGFETELARLEGGCFGSLAGGIGGLVGSRVALAVGASSPANGLLWAGASLLGAAGAAGSAAVSASLAGSHTSVPPWQA